jgi:hypothetical protein
VCKAHKDTFKLRGPEIANRAIDAKDPHWDTGEELEDFVDVVITKPYKKGHLRDMKHAIICGNGGGRWSTIRWFNRHRLTVTWFEKAMEKRCSYPIHFNLDEACAAIKAKEHKQYIEGALRAGFEVYGPKISRKRCRDGSGWNVMTGPLGLDSMMD